MTDTITLYRFCSADEFRALFWGRILQNHTDHYGGGKGGSTSVGFCLTEDEPYVAWRYLKGIVTPHVCMKLVIPRDQLVKSRGKYAGRIVTYNGCTYADTIYKDEWCTTILRPEWLKDIIFLEDIAPIEDIQAARCHYNLKQSNHKANETTPRNAHRIQLRPIPNPQEQENRQHLILDRARASNASPGDDEAVGKGAKKENGNGQN